MESKLKRQPSQEERTAAERQRKVSWARNFTERVAESLAHPMTSNFEVCVLVFIGESWTASCFRGTVKLHFLLEGLIIRHRHCI